MHYRTSLSNDWIVCGFDRASKASILNRAKHLGLNGNVNLTGFVSDAALVELYKRRVACFSRRYMRALDFQSWKGWLVVFPWLAQTLLSLQEVGGKFAQYFDPYNIQEMADSLYRTLSEPIDYTSRLRRFEYSKMYSGQKTASLTLNAFVEGLAKPQIIRASLVR